MAPLHPEAAQEMPSARELLGNGMRRQKRTHGGMHRARKHLERRRLSSGSGDASQSGPVASWLYFTVFAFMDLVMIFANTLVWSIASVFLFFFSRIHDTILLRIVGFHYIYNVSWEDPRTDRKALNLTDRDHVLTIASAGDNCLSFIIDGARVTAVDLNPYQLALCELKRAVIKELDYETCFAIFAQQDLGQLREHYPRLRTQLGTSATTFWDNTLPRMTNIMYSGSSGWLAFILFRVILPLCGFGWIRKALLEGVDKEEFRRRVRKHETRFEFLAWIADSVLVPIFAPLAGVPEAQLNLGDEREGNVHTIIERVFLNSDLVHDNYFFLGYILGYYTHECCPRYLRAEHYETLKAAMRANRFELFHGTLADRLRLDAQQAQPPSYTAAIMLDHLDWMDDAGVNEELSLLWPLLDEERGRVLWRSFSGEPHRAALKWLQAKKVDDGTDDRTGMYWGVWVADKKTCGNHPMLTSPGLFWSERKPQATLEKLITGAKIVAFPVVNHVMTLASSATSRLTGVSVEDLSNNAHAKKIESFYASQASAYDAFREDFLHARKQLATCLPLKPGKLVWVDVGAGTARNLEFFPVETLKSRFSKIYILDISPSLLEVARNRVHAAGLEDLVELVLADFTDLSDMGRAVLPQAGSADLVTFSYSLSMIPSKQAALRQAAMLLKDGGFLAVADFFAHGESSFKTKPLTRYLSNTYDEGCRLWFKQDGVHLLQESIFNAVEPDEVLFVHGERFRGSVPLVPFLRPWHGVWIARKGAEPQL